MSMQNTRSMRSNIINLIMEIFYFIPKTYSYAFFSTSKDCYMANRIVSLSQQHSVLEIVNLHNNSCRHAKNIYVFIGVKLN